jgi:hypothetical protein
LTTIIKVVSILIKIGKTMALGGRRKGLKMYLLSDTSFNYEHTHTHTHCGVVRSQ